MVMTTGPIDMPPDEFCKIGDRQCIQALPERVFQVFTTFYAHTQSICFYLMSQVWHDETEQTIDSLRLHSKSVSQKLEFAGRLQANMLEQQREGLKLQRHLIEHGMNLSQALSESRETLFALTSEFRNSTIEHTRLLGELFGRLRFLHNWFASEYAFVNQMLYYTGWMVLIVLLTTTRRSASARLILFGCTAVKIVAEYLLTTLWMIGDIDAPTNKGDEKLDVYFYVCWLRKLFAIGMAVIYVRLVWSYVDKDALKVSTLLEIVKQNEEILKLLRTAHEEKEAAEQEAATKDHLKPMIFRARIRKRSEETVTESTEDLIGGVTKMDVFNREGSTFSMSSMSRYPVRLRKKTKLI